MVVRLTLFTATAIVTLAACSAAYGQASAGCGEIHCGGTPSGASGSKTGNGAMANNSRNARAAAAMQSIQNTERANQQILQNGADQMLNILTSGQGDATGDSNAPTPVSGSTDIVDNFNVYTPPPTVYTWQPAPPPSTSAAVSALLDSDPPATSTASAVSALLDDSSQPNAAQPTGSGTTTANVVANLLDSSKVSDSASVFSLPPPADPQFNAALQESTDQPDQTQSRSIMQDLQSAGQEVNDKLTGLVSSGNALVSQLSNDPIVYLVVNQYWNGTTAPLAGTPQLTESNQETATNLAFGQAAVGLGDIFEGIAAEGPLGVPKGIYIYGSKMVNQMGSYLGLATSTVFEEGANGEQ